jgi:hypothetical protein
VLRWGWQNRESAKANYGDGGQRSLGWLLDCDCCCGGRRLMMGFAAYGRLLIERLMLFAMTARGAAVVRKLHARGGADDQHQHAEDNGEIANGLLHATL